MASPARACSGLHASGPRNELRAHRNARGAANAYGRGGGNQTSFPNAGGTYSCSKESYRCPPKSISDPTPSPPCDGDTSKFAWNGTYSGPQFDPVGGYPGKYASEGIYTYGFGNNQGQNAGGQQKVQPRARCSNTYVRFPLAL